MPDYSLMKRNTPSLQQAQPEAPTPLAMLSSASQQSKTETQNALLREALATSAQNCEALMKQSNQSLEEIKQTVSQWIDWLKKEQQKNQEQLKQLENMNEAFSKSLNAVLTHTNGKFASQLKAEVDTAIKANIQAMDTAAKRMEQTSANVTGFEKTLKTTLDKRIKAYDSSINQLFKLDGWRHWVFWVGIAGGILTPIALIAERFF